MLKVTKKAKIKLQEALELRNKKSEITFRMVATPSTPQGLKITLDKERKGDQIVESDEGITVLLVEPRLAKDLEGKLFDYKETAEGAGFTLSDPATDDR